MMSRQCDGCWWPDDARIRATRSHECHWLVLPEYHYCDVIMGPIASQITSLTSVYSIVYSDADQRKHQCSASLAFVRGIHRWPVNSPHKWPVTRKMFPFDDVIMITVRLSTGSVHYKCVRYLLVNSATSLEIRARKYEPSCAVIPTYVGFGVLRRSTNNITINFICQSIGLFTAAWLWEQRIFQIFE